MTDTEVKHFKYPELVVEPITIDWTVYSIAEFSTVEEAEQLSDRIGIMRDGKLLALGTAEELKAKTGKERFEDAFVAMVKGERA